MSQEEGWPSQLVVVRHAESMRNVAKKGATYFADEEARRLVKGIPDNKIELTERGVDQARLTGLGLYQDFGVFDYIYHSGYRRAEHTAELIRAPYTDSERARSRFYHDTYLRERHAGYTYDMTKEEADRYFPWLEDYWNTFGGFHACPPGGESIVGMVERAHSFLRMLHRERSGKKVCLVTHGEWMRALRYKAERWSDDDAVAWKPEDRPRNCAVLVYEPDEDGNLALKVRNKMYWS